MHSVNSFINLEHDLTDYLLDINDLVLKPDTLMYDNVKDAYVFIYIPGYSQDENEFHNSLLALWEYILSKYDHDSDMKRTMKVYETYQKIRSCNYTIGTLLYNMISVENVSGNMLQTETHLIIHRMMKAEVHMFIRLTLQAVMQLKVHSMKQV